MFANAERWPLKTPQSMTSHTVGVDLKAQYILFSIRCLNICIQLGHTVKPLKKSRNKASVVNILLLTMTKKSDL